MGLTDFSRMKCTYVFSLLGWDQTNLNSKVEAVCQFFKNLEVYAMYE